MPDNILWLRFIDTGSSPEILGKHWNGLRILGSKRPVHESTDRNSQRLHMKHAIFDFQCATKITAAELLGGLADLRPCQFLIHDQPFASLSMFFILQPRRDDLHHQQYHHPWMLSGLDLRRPRVPFNPLSHTNDEELNDASLYGSYMFFWSANRKA